VTGTITGYCFFSNYSIYKSFKRINIGMPESKVVKLLGKPSKVVLSGDKLFWSSYLKNSVKEYHYDAKLLPEIWIIGFDSKNNVVCRIHNIM